MEWKTLRRGAHFFAGIMPTAWQRLKQAAENCKIELDHAEKTTVELPFLFQNKSLKVVSLVVAVVKNRIAPCSLSPRVADRNQPSAV